MGNSKSVSTPTGHVTKLVKTLKVSQPIDQEKHQSAVGSLLYLSTGTRPDIAYAVCTVARYCYQSTLHHWVAVKHIFPYLNGTLDYGLNSILKGYYKSNRTMSILIIIIIIIINIIIGIYLFKVGL